MRTEPSASWRSRRSAHTPVSATSVSGAITAPRRWRLFPLNLPIPSNSTSNGYPVAGLHANVAFAILPTPDPHLHNSTYAAGNVHAQVPDFLNACIAGEPAMEVVKDEEWFRHEFTPTVAGRGESHILEKQTINRDPA